LKFRKGGDERSFDPFQRGEVNGGGDGVVAGLAAIDVVVGVDEFVARVFPPRISMARWQ